MTITEHMLYMTCTVVAVMTRSSCLRSPTWPSATTDVGAHDHGHHPPSVIPLAPTCVARIDMIVMAHTRARREAVAGELDGPVVQGLTGF